MTNDQLIRTWAYRVQRLKIGHYCAAARFERRGVRLGVIVICISSIAPAVAYIASAYDVAGDRWVVLGIAMIVFISGMLSTMQIFLRHSERAERRRAAGATYAKLELEVEKIAAFLPQEALSQRQSIEDLQDEWERVTGGSPVIPQDIYERECSGIEGERPRAVAH